MLLSGGNAQAQTPGSASDENQRTGQHILNAPAGEDEAVLYRSTAILTPVDHIGNTHDSREDRTASFVRAQAPDDFEEPDNYALRARLRGLDERRLGILRAAISATDLTIPLTSVTGLRVGESLEIGRSGNTHNGELMRIASIDTANNNVSVVERFDAFAQFAAPQAWPTGTAVDHHRRARPENLPGYMVKSGQSPIINTFRLTWQGMDVPYLSMNLEFPGGDSQLKDWEQLLIYMRFRRADSTGTMIEGILPLAAGALVTTRPLGDPYTVREQHLRRYLGWPENLDNDPDGSQQVGLVNDANRAAEFISGPERTFLQDMIDWIFEDNGHDLGRIYPWDDRYNATELAALEADPPTASEDVVRSYQIVVDVALLNGADPRIDVEQFSITPPDTDPDGDGGGGGGGGPRTSAPGAPRNLTAVGGNGEVVLTWDVPASDGGAEITDYEYRINGRNPWISIGSTLTTHTVTGLDNGTAYTFQVRAVNRVGGGRVPNQTEATPEAPEVFTLDFAHFANGDGTTSELAFVNVGSVPVRPDIYFYNTEGNLIAAESVVDVTGDLEVQEDGGLTVLTEMEPLGELTIATHGQGELVSGSVTVVSNAPIGGMLRYDLPHIGEAVVGASPPVRDALFVVRCQEGGITTGVAVHNLEEEAMEVVCELMQEGVLHDAVSLPSGGQRADGLAHRRGVPRHRYVRFRGIGSLRCTGDVQRRGPGNGPRHPHLPHPAAVSGEPARRRRGGPGLCTLRQWGWHHLRSGVRECIHPAESSRAHSLSFGHPSNPPRYLFLRHRGQSDCRRIGGGRHGRSGDPRGRSADGPDGNGAAGSAHGLDPRARGAGERIGESGLGGSHRRDAPL